MSGYFISNDELWTSQPPELTEVSSEYAHLVSSARAWNIPATVPAESIRRGLAGFTKTGTIDVVGSAGGVGVEGDGGTGLYARTISVVPQPMWMVARFALNSVTTTQKTIFSLGSAGVTTPAYCGIFSGNGTTSDITIQFRAVDSGPAISKVASISMNVGRVYTVVAVFPTALKADAYVYVNGIKYNADTASSLDISFAAPSTLANESVGALKRGTTAVYGSDTILFTARGVGVIPEALAQQISNNPYSLLEPEHRGIYVPVAGGTDVSVNVTGVSGTTALGAVTVTAGASTTVTGVSGTTALGTVTVTAGASTTVTGVSGTTTLNSVTVSAGGSVDVSVTGVSGTTALGTVTVETTTPDVSVNVTGVSATTALGTVTVTTTAGTNVSVEVTGVSAIARLGSVLVWGLVDTSQTPGWNTINSSQTPSWVQIPT